MGFFFLAQVDCQVTSTAELLNFHMKPAVLFKIPHAYPECVLSRVLVFMLCLGDAEPQKKEVVLIFISSHHTAFLATQYGVFVDERQTSLCCLLTFFALST